MVSLWEKTSAIPGFDRLEGDINTDVLIIGGGLAGILCAYKLKQAGVDYVLVEANRVCSGITKNTTAKITSQHGFIYEKLIRQFGEDTARLYLRANEEAVDSYRKLCENIDCHFEEKDNIIYSRKSISKVKKEIDALHTLGYPAEIIDNLPLPFPTFGGVKFKNQAQFNPLEFVTAIVQGLR
ncbi:MAG TPA: FAD-binding oxidoreductase, partial [Bacillota bacterium]|nr:FAD-binding oxidoreductase [Bacillota bacterium]